MNLNPFLVEMKRIALEGWL